MGHRRQHGIVGRPSRSAPIVPSTARAATVTDDGSYLMRLHDGPPCRSTARSVGGRPWRERNSDRGFESWPPMGSSGTAARDLAGRYRRSVTVPDAAWSWSRPGPRRPGERRWALALAADPAATAAKTAAPVSRPWPATASRRSTAPDCTSTGTLVGSDSGPASPSATPASSPSTASSSTPWPRGSARSTACASGSTGRAGPRQGHRPDHPRAPRAAARAGRHGQRPGRLPRPPAHDDGRPRLLLHADRRRGPALPRHPLAQPRHPLRPAGSRRALPDADEPAGARSP